MNSANRAITQRIDAEAYAERRGLRPDQAGYWSLVAGVLSGHLIDRDAEAAALLPPHKDQSHVRIAVEHRGVPYVIDYSHDDEATCVDVARLYCGPHDLLPMLGNEYAQTPQWAVDAAYEDMQRHADAIRRHYRRLETEMVCGTDRLVQEGA